MDEASGVPCRGLEGRPEAQRQTAFAPARLHFFDKDPGTARIKLRAFHGTLPLNQALTALFVVELRNEVAVFLPNFSHVFK